MPGAIDAALRKFHASLNVSNVERSIAFYRVLFGVEPAKVRSDYAKVDVAEPPLLLSLIPGRPQAGGHLNHVGLRVRNACRRRSARADGEARSRVLRRSPSGRGRRGPAEEILTFTWNAAAADARS